MKCTNHKFGICTCCWYPEVCEHGMCDKCGRLGLDIKDVQQLTKAYLKLGQKQ